MKILYIYRNKSLGFSIAKVFHTIELEMKRYAEVDSFYLPIAGAKPWSLWKNIQAAYKKANSQPYDIIHITGSEHYLIPFLSYRHKIIVTVHDLGFFTKEKKSLRTFYLYLLWIKTLKYANIITCVSKKTEKEVSQLVKIRNSQIYTIHNPIGNEFDFTPKLLNKECPRILHLGTKPNKNLINSIKALSGISCHLRIIGKLSQNEKSLLQNSNMDYSNAYNLSDDEIVDEYKICDIVNFPSLYEGFGLPIIEAQAIGRVCITSNIEPMVSIANGGAYIVNPHDIASIHNAYIKVIHWEELRNELITKGRNNIENYKLSSIIKQYVKIYKQLIDKN